VSLERAYNELNRRGRAAASTVEALMFSLRGGVNELEKPDTMRRLSVVDSDQVQEISERLQNIAPAWSPDQVAALVAIWSKLHE